MKNLDFVERIGGETFSRMVVAAAAGIEENRQLVNELNVFPVPDGDTGTNMSLTLGAAAIELGKTPQIEVGSAVEIAAAALLRGARGNSGVILSLLFRGIAAHLKGMETMDGADLAQALTKGAEVSYRAVMKPTEGTMLTVFRVSAAHAVEISQTENAIEHVLTETLISAQAALAETIHQNPVLEKAGVIDAGAKGYCIILECMLSALQGRAPVKALAAQASRPTGVVDFSSYADEAINFSYCTEFIINRLEKKDPLLLSAFLETLGDSLVLVDDDEIIKVHVHTNNPGKALEEALTFGSLTAVKIENMREQHTEQVVRQEAHGASGGKPVAASPRKPFGFVSVCAGAGLTEVFLDLGVDRIISGGQTMNPSTEDILTAIEQTPSEVVFVLPNNKNIILAAEQCVPLSSKQVEVIPSRTVPQGVAAMLAFETTRSLQENREAMGQALSSVYSGHITYAARDSRYDGQVLFAGDHMALSDRGLVCHHPDRAVVVRLLARDISGRSPSFVTVFYGQGVTEAEAEQTVAVFSECCPGTEVQLISGGQPVYFYIISAE